MNAKDFLSQAYMLNQRINCKYEQIKSLNELATKCTSIITGMPHAPSKETSSLEVAVCKMVDLKTEIGNEAIRLVELKEQIGSAIKQLDKPEYQLVLESRYLCGHSWEQIAVKIGFTIHHIYKVHNKALEKIGEILKLDTKSH